MGCPMSTPTTTKIASTARAGPRTISGVLGSALRVIDQTARSCAARPERSGAGLSSFFFEARATPRVYECRDLGQQCLGFGPLTRPAAVGDHRRPGVTPGAALSAVLPDRREQLAGDIGKG